MARFEKGRSGNPKGRPKGVVPRIDLVAEIKKQLAEVDATSLQTRAETVVKTLVDAACAGDVKASRELLDRTMGRASAGEIVRREEEQQPSSNRRRPTPSGWRSRNRGRSRRW